MFFDQSFDILGQVYPDTYPAIEYPQGYPYLLYTQHNIYFIVASCERHAMRRLGHIEGLPWPASYTDMLKEYGSTETRRMIKKHGGGIDWVIKNGMIFFKKLAA